MAPTTLTPVLFGQVDPVAGSIIVALIGAFVTVGIRWAPKTRTEAAVDLATARNQDAEAWEKLVEQHRAAAEMWRAEVESLRRELAEAHTEVQQLREALADLRRAATS